MNQTIFEVPAGHLFKMRIARQQRAVTQVHRNCRAISKRHGFEEPLETGRRDGPCDDPDKLALLPDHRLLVLLDRLEPDGFEVVDRVPQSPIAIAGAVLVCEGF